MSLYIKVKVLAIQTLGVKGTQYCNCHTAIKLNRLTMLACTLRKKQRPQKAKRKERATCKIAAKLLKKIPQNTRGQITWIYSFFNPWISCLLSLGPFLCMKSTRSSYRSWSNYCIVGLSYLELSGMVGDWVDISFFGVLDGGLVETAIFEMFLIGSIMGFSTVVCFLLLVLVGQFACDWHRSWVEPSFVKMRLRLFDVFLLCLET